MLALENSVAVLQDGACQVRAVRCVRCYATLYAGESSRCAPCIRRQETQSPRPVRWELRMLGALVAPLPIVAVIVHSAGYCVAGGILATIAPVVILSIALVVRARESGEKC